MSSNFAQTLLHLGLPKETSIYRWTLHDMHIHEAALKSFMGAKLEVVQ